MVVRENSLGLSKPNQHFISAQSNQNFEKRKKFKKRILDKKKNLKIIKPDIPAALKDKQCQGLLKLYWKVKETSSDDATE